MHESTDSSAAILFDLADQLQLDGESGLLPPLEHYLARFPGHAEAVTREYEAARARLAARLDAPRVSKRSSTPDRVGPYRIVELLGRGGQGVVYKAEDERFQRVVALKVLSISLASVAQGRRSRFRREAEIVSRLDHPGICTILDADLEADSPYIAMRYIEGETLAVALSRVRAERAENAELGFTPTPTPTPTPTSASRLLAPRRALELSEALAFFEHAARALHAAHEAGVVHRDIKPGNLMVSKDGAPVILDFGLARHDEEQESNVLTRSGEVFGTPAYISPEQLESGRDVDRRADVYSLGVVLYECLTLERPFRGDTGTALAHAIKTQPLPSVRKLNASLSRDLEIVLETALEKDVSRRYASALELAEELRRVRSYEPIHARPAGPTLRLWRWMQRKPVLATATLGSIATLSIALVVALVLLDRVQSERNRKEAALALYQGAFYRDAATSMQTFVPLRALALAIAAAERDPGLASNRVLLSVLDSVYQKQALTWPLGMALWVDISPRGDRLVASSNDGAIRLWDPSSGALLATFSNSSDSVWHVDFSPDGKRVVSSAADGKVSIWDLEHPDAPPLLLRGHEVDVEWAEFSPDGARVVTASRDGTVRVWDSSSGAELLRLAGHTGPVSEARFVARGTRILTRSAEPLHNSPQLQSDRTARLFDARDGRELCVFGGHALEVRAVATTEDLSWVVTVSADATARIYHLDAQPPHDPQALHVIDVPGRLHATAISPDGRLVGLAYDPGARVVELESGRTLYELPGHERRTVAWIQFSPDGETLATVARDGALRLFRARDGELLHLCRGDTRTVRSGAWSPDGSWIATWQSQARIDVWYGKNRPFLQVLRGHTDEVVGARFDAAGERVVTASRDGSARIWSARDGELVARLEVDERERRPLLGASFAPDGKSVVTTDAGGCTRVRALDGRELLRIDGRGAVGIAASFSADGNLLCAPTGGGGVRLVDLAQARSQDLAAHEGELCVARFSPDGRWLATGGRDRTVALWKLARPGAASSPRQEIVAASSPRQENDAASSPRQEHDAASSPREPEGEVLATLQWRTTAFQAPRFGLDAVYDLAFDPSGPRLAAALESMDDPLIDLESGVELARAHSATMGRLAFSRDGRFLIGASKWANQNTLWEVERDGPEWRLTTRLPSDVLRYQSHSSSPTALVRAAHCERVVSGSLDRTARLWEIGNEECLAVFVGHTDAIWDTDITADGTLVVTASADGTARLWPTDLLATAKRFQPASTSDALATMPQPMPHANVNTDR